MASAFCAAKFRCVVLEALDQVGGKTIGLHSAWINDTNQSEVYSLAKSFGLDLVEQYMAGTNLCQKKDGRLLPYASGFGEVRVPCTTSVLRVC